MKPTDKTVAWKREIAIERLESCVVMLAVHGFISDAEKRNIRKRLQKWVDKHSLRKESHDQTK